MLYINQQDYPDIPYRTNLDDPASRGATRGTVASSACGLCSMMMVVDQLTMESFSLEEAIRFAHEVNADRKVGTDMEIFGAACALRFGLTMSVSDDSADVEACLREGGRVIMNVGGDHDGYTGLLSDVGHYVVIISAAQGEFCVLDPAWRPGKYTVPGRAGRLRQDGRFLYTSAEELMKETANRSPGFYMFRRASSER